MRASFSFLLFASLPLVSVAAAPSCSSEDDKKAPSSSLTGGFTTATGGGGSRATTGATSGSGEASATSTTSSGPDHSYCAKGCDADADCCPPGASNCPGDFPNNYSCREGICIPAHCESDANCLIGTCHEVGGIGTCFNPCSTDEDCSAIPEGGCDGVADDGVKYCTVPTAPCVDDGDCFGTGRCREGVCTCDTDEDCTGTTDTCVHE
jgi:hypothetical protein